jgi:hypothetical protein
LTNEAAACDALYRGHSGPVHAIAIADLADRLYTASADATVCIYDIHRPGSTPAPSPAPRPASGRPPRGKASSGPASVAPLLVLAAGAAVSALAVSAGVLVAGLASGEALAVDVGRLCVHDKGTALDDCPRAAAGAVCAHHGDTLHLGPDAAARDAVPASSLVLWRLRLGADVRAISVAGDTAVVGGFGGVVCAVSLREGRVQGFLQTASQHCHRTGDACEDRLCEEVSKAAASINAEESREASTTTLPVISSGAKVTNVAWLTDGGGSNGGNACIAVGSVNKGVVRYPLLINNDHR